MAICHNTRLKLPVPTYRLEPLFTRLETDCWIFCLVVVFGHKKIGGGLHLYINIAKNWRHATLQTKKMRKKNAPYSPFPSLLNYQALRKKNHPIAHHPIQ